MTFFIFTQPPQSLSILIFTCEVEAMELHTASLTETTLLDSPSERFPTSVFMNILNNRVTQKQVFCFRFFCRYTVIHIEQNTLLAFKHSFKERCHLLSLYSLSMLGCFPSSIAEFVLICPHCATQVPLRPRIHPDKVLKK